MHSKQTVKTMHENSQTRLTSTPLSAFWSKNCLACLDFSVLQFGQGLICIDIIIIFVAPCVTDHLQMSLQECGGKASPSTFAPVYRAVISDWVTQDAF